ncbi:hypothetical protein F5Y12DRAFT_715889 [Xylaria sp. FL1777]|nr:hypothetical protein F5Y12DRAFT_715889 [Xylaria sp. FL1777]
MSSRNNEKVVYNVPPHKGPRPWATRKRIIWTGAFFAVTVVGSIYGAGLKTQQEYHAEKKQILESTPEERIRALEVHRARLVREKLPLERKREELRLRLQKQNEAAKTSDTRS